MFFLITLANMVQKLTLLNVSLNSPAFCFSDIFWCNGVAPLSYMIAAVWDYPEILFY